MRPQQHATVACAQGTGASRRVGGTVAASSSLLSLAAVRAVCTEAVVQPEASAAAVDAALFCGYKAVRAQRVCIGFVG